MPIDHCPHLNCDTKISDCRPGRLVFCDDCRGAVLICPHCDCTNRLWAVYCRACGRGGLNRHKVIRNYRPEYLSNQKEEDHLYYRKTLEDRTEDNWNALMRVVDGALMVFSGTRSSLFNRVRILHPHTGGEPFDILQKDRFGDSDLNGAATMLQPHLYMASTAGLIRIASASISGEAAFQPEHTAQMMSMTGDDIINMDGRRILLATRRKSTRKISFQTIETHTQKASDPLEVDGMTYTLSSDTLMVAGTKAISLYDLGEENGSPSLKLTIELGSWVCASRPTLVNKSIYLLAGRSGREKKSLLKWALGGSEVPSLIPEEVMESDEIQNISLLTDNTYLIVNYDGIRIHKAVYDDAHKIINLGNGIHTAVDPAVNIPLLAIPYINQTTYSIAVIDGLTGQYVFTTPSYYRIYSLKLWGRFLFVLAKTESDGAVEVFGYDMKENSNEPSS